VIVDLQGQAIPSSDDAPSMERGANLLAEMLINGPEFIGLSFAQQNQAQRRQILGDLHELQMFLRETWSALNNYHLAHVEADHTQEEIEK
jgi:hypothetical protein